MTTLELEIVVCALVVFASGIVTVVEAVVGAFVEVVSSTVTVVVYWTAVVSWISIKYFTFRTIV